MGGTDSHSFVQPSRGAAREERSALAQGRRRGEFVGVEACWLARPRGCGLSSSFLDSCSRRYDSFSWGTAILHYLDYRTELTWGRDYSARVPPPASLTNQRGLTRYSWSVSLRGRSRPPRPQSKRRDTSRPPPRQAPGAPVMGCSASRAAVFGPFRARADTSILSRVIGMGP